MNSVPLFLGLDYSEAVVQLCAVDAGGTMRINRGCRNDWRELVKAVADQGVVQRVAIEACSGSADLAGELMAQAGWHVELAHPYYVSKLKGSPDKTDFSDARLLADLTRVGYLPRTWLAPAYIRDLRQLVGYRQQLVNERRAKKLRVGGLLREHRVKPVLKLSRWSKAWIAFVRCTEQLSEHARWIANQDLDQIAELSERIARAEARLREATAQDQVVQRLMKQEGIGEVTAWVMRAFVAEFARFNNGKQLSRYCGLSPRNASSGVRQADAGLIKSSNKILRATIIQAAHRLIRQSDRWGRLADSLRDRGKPACVIAAAVGNRWMRKLYHVMAHPCPAAAASPPRAVVGGKPPGARERTRPPVSAMRMKSPAATGGKGLSIPSAP
jgi:transposase